MAIPKNFDQKSEQGVQIGMQFHYKSKNYEVAKLITVGESSEIYLAQSLPKNSKSSQFVIKKYNNAYFEGKKGDGDCKHTWQHEALMVIMQEESKEHALQLLDKIEVKTFSPIEYYLFLNLIEGDSLERWYTEKYKNTTAVNADIKNLLKKVALPIAKHLSYLHDQWIVYLNLLIKNITVFVENPKNEIKYPILIDWSRAKEVNPSDIHRPQDITINREFKENAKKTFAKNNYRLAPEIIADAQPNALTDIYMFGSILFYLLTGDSGVLQENAEKLTEKDFVLEPRMLNSSVPRELNQFVIDLTQFKPSRRIKTMGEVIKQLDKIANSIELAKKEIKSKRKIEALNEISAESQKKVLGNANSPNLGSIDPSEQRKLPANEYLSNDDQDFYDSYSVESEGDSEGKNKLKWPLFVDLSTANPENTPDTSKISCTFTILNNNLEYIFFAEPKSITLRDIIHEGNGYVPDYIYSHLLSQFAIDTVIFDIGFNQENQTFSIKSIFDLTISDMANQSKIKFEPYLLSAGKISDLAEEVVTSLQTGGFWRIRVWVY